MPAAETLDKPSSGHAPADAARDSWIIGASEDAARILPGKDQIDIGGAVAMPTKAAHLRQKTGDRLILPRVEASRWRLHRHG